MEKWWGSVWNVVKEVEGWLEREREVEVGKELPPLPGGEMSDEEDDDEEDDDTPVPSKITTTTTTTSSVLSSSRPTTTRSVSSTSSKAPAWLPFLTPYPPSVPFIPTHESLTLLSSLRKSLASSEEKLKKMLDETPVECINDVRGVFRRVGRGVGRRLEAWVGKHARGCGVEVGGMRKSKMGGKDGNGKDGRKEEGGLGTEPEWWAGGCYAVPGGKVVVREGESGSIIAYTLRYTVLFYVDS